MITIYKTARCAYCPMVEKYLKMKGITYQSVDITDDLELRQDVINRSGAMTVPVTVKGDWDYFVVGWNPGKLAGLIK
jgi:glutaredoxin